MKFKSIERDDLILLGLMLVIALLNLYSYFEIPLFAKNLSGIFSYWLIVFIVSILAFGAYIFYVIKKNKYQINLIYPILFGIILLIDIIVVGSTSNTINQAVVGYDKSIINYSINVTGEMKACYIFRFINELMLVFLAIKFIFNYLFKKDILVIACLLTILFCLICAIYSYITEWDKYVNFLNYIKDDMYHHSTQSFFANRNVYALALYIGICACIILLNLFKNKKIKIASSILILFLLFTLIITTSKAPLLLTLLILCAELTIVLIHYWKRNKRIAGILTGIISGIILTAILLFTLSPLKDYFVGLVNNIPVSLEGRGILLDKTFQIMNSHPISYAFGNGHLLFSDILQTANNLDLSYLPNVGCFSSHNLYVEMLANGGIPSLIVVIGGIILVGKKLFNKTNFCKKYQFLTMCLFMSIILDSLIETIA